nr:hypothetical protein [Pseudolysinimonas kribbensis]
MSTTTAAPTSGPRTVPVPPSTTITRARADAWNPADAGLMNSVCQTRRMPAIPATTPESTTAANLYAEMP